MLSLTLKQMLDQGNVFHLIGMGIIFIVMIFLISKIGKGVAAKFAGENQVITSAAISTGNNAVTAAIVAAVNEFRKNK